MDRGWPYAIWPVIAKALSRWGHILLTVVLIGIGLVGFVHENGLWLNFCGPACGHG